MYDSILEDISTKSPLLIMGSYVQQFRKQYPYPIKSVRNADEVRDMVSQYTGIKTLEYPLVIEDLSFLDTKSSFLLLKLVEESKYPIIMLATFDKVSSIILSRVKEIQKAPLEPIQSEFMPAGQGYTRMEEYLAPDSHYYDKLRFMIKNSPTMYFYENKIGRIRNKSKILTLLD